MPPKPKKKPAADADEGPGGALPKRAQQPVFYVEIKETYRAANSRNPKKGFAQKLQWVNHDVAEDILGRTRLPSARCEAMTSFCTF